MYLRDSISFSERNDLILDSLEMICVQTKKLRSKSFLVCIWYRPPNSNIGLMADFESFRHNCDAGNHELLIMADLNCDFQKSPMDSSTKRLQLLSSLYQLDQLISEPTRVTGTSATMIDLIFSYK